MTEKLLDPKEKLLVEYVISDTKLLSQVHQIFKPEYFFRPASQIVEFIRDYYTQYKATPPKEVIYGEFEIELEEKEVDQSTFQYALDEIESHAKKRAIRNAIESSIDILHEEKYSTIESYIREALRVQLDNSLGLSYFDDPEERINEANESIEVVPTGIQAIDELIGGLKRKELGILAGESGLGKSNSLINITYRLAEKGYNVVYITLELSPEQVASRLDGMITGYPVNEVLEHPETVTKDLSQIKDQYGSVDIKYMPAESTTSDVMAYLLEYQIQNGYYPDGIIVDYLDEMGTEKTFENIGEREKRITAGLRNIIVETNGIGVTAAQLTKDSADVTKINRSMVSGGAFKVNKSDFTLGITASEEDIDNNILRFSQIKIRSHNKVSGPRTAYINPKNLRITNNPIQAKDIQTGSANKFVKVHQQNHQMNSRSNENEEEEEDGHVNHASDLIRKRLSLTRSL